MKSATLGHMRVILVLALLLIGVGSAARQLAAPKVLAGEALEEAQQFYERTSGKDVPAALGMAHSSMARVIDGLKHAVADPALDTDSPTAAQMAVLSQIYQGTYSAGSYVLLGRVPADKWTPVCQQIAIFLSSTAYVKANELHFYCPGAEELMAATNKYHGAVMAQTRLRVEAEDAAKAQEAAERDAERQASERGELTVGARAPDFKMLGSDGAMYELSKLRGRTVVLSWLLHVGTSSTTMEYESLSDSSSAIKQFDVAMLTATIGSIDEAKTIAAAKAATPLAVLADPDGSVATRYGVSRPVQEGLVVAAPRTFYIGADGVILAIDRGKLPSGPGMWKGLRVQEWTVGPDILKMLGRLNVRRVAGK